MLLASRPRHLLRLAAVAEHHALTELGHELTMDLKHSRGFDPWVLPPPEEMSAGASKPQVAPPT